MSRRSLSAPPGDANPEDHLRLDLQLCFRLYAASRLITRLYQPLLEPLGLTYPQYIVLMILWEDAPCPVSRIGARPAQYQHADPAAQAARAARTGATSAPPR